MKGKVLVSLELPALDTLDRFRSFKVTPRSQVTRITSCKIRPLQVTRITSYKGNSHHLAQDQALLAGNSHHLVQGH